MTYSIPDAALNSHVGILGKTGSGKSYTARGLAERLLHMHRQVVIVDPTGAWYGLRTGFEIPIFGGRHGDVEIGDMAGEPVAGVIVEQSASAIIDLSLMTASGQKRFMRDFAHRLRAKPPGALYLFLDEADEFLPQEKVKGGGRGTDANTDLNLFGDLKWMVRRGRLNGFRVTMITQRPAEIAKAVLTQIETLVAHRLTAPQDRRAVEEWVKGHADPDAHKEVLSSLASLEKGVAWVWAPDLDILAKAKMPAIETFDSGRTPEPGEIEVKPPALADLNLTAIKEKLASVVEEAKANDPRALKVEIARLTRELAKSESGKHIVASAPAWPDQREEVAALSAKIDEALLALEQMKASAAELERRQQVALAALGGESVSIPVVTRPQRRVPPALAPVQRQPIPVRAAVQSEGEVPAGCAKALAALAAVYPSGLTEAQWSTAAGYKRSGGTWGTYKSRLRGAGLIESREGRWFATEAGAAAVGDVELPPSPGPDLVRWWAAKLPGTPKIAEALIGAWPHAMSRDELAEAVGMTASGGSFGTYLSRLAGPGLIERGRGDVRLSAEVMGQ